MDDKTLSSSNLPESSNGGRQSRTSSLARTASSNISQRISSKQVQQFGIFSAIGYMTGIIMMLNFVRTAMVSSLIIGFSLAASGGFHLSKVKDEIQHIRSKGLRALTNVSPETISTVAFTVGIICCLFCHMGPIGIVISTLAYFASGY